MVHNPKNWIIVASIQITILLGSFNLPNSIINGPFWFAPIIDIGRISSLFAFPAVDSVLVLRLLAIGRRKKEYIRKYIDPSNYDQFDLIEPIYFISITQKQIDSIQLAFNNSRDDLIFDTSFPFDSLQKCIQGSKNV